MVLTLRIASVLAPAAVVLVRVKSVDETMGSLRRDFVSEEPLVCSRAI